MWFFERAHAVYCLFLQDQITEPVLKSLLDRIAKD
jgi:acyl-[acyl-carrier-protein] desaturase